MIFLVRVLQLRVCRRRLAVGVIARSLEVVHALVTTEGGVARVGRPGVLRRFDLLLRRRRVLIVLIIGIR